LQCDSSSDPLKLLKFGYIIPAQIDPEKNNNINMILGFSTQIFFPRTTENKRRHCGSAHTSIVVCDSGSAYGML
jgi:hypothetical protein